MERLKQYLEENKLTQLDLAKQLGVTQPTVWEWLKGESKPSAERLIAISKLTGISIDSLLGNRPETRKSIAASRAI